MQNTFDTHHGMKYNLKETPAIRITCQEDMGNLTMAVTDHGIGMATQDIPRIFELFETLGVRDINANKAQILVRQQ